MKIFEEREMNKVSEFLVEKFGKEREILVEQIIMVENGILIIFNIENPAQQKVCMFGIDAAFKWCEDC